MNVVIDDRLLIEEILIGLGRRRARLHTTQYWYYRACRAAVSGAGGHLSGPFLSVPELEQQRAVAAMLRLPEEIGLPDARQIIPFMVEISTRYPQLNLLNLEAIAAVRSLGARLWLSPKGATGVLPAVADAEGVTWEIIPI